MAAWTALILTGGGSTRMGRDKAGITVGGRTMLDRLLAGLPSTVPVVVAGPKPATTVRSVTVRREEPPGGGPAAGVAAGLTAVTTELVAVCAVDIPFAASLLPTLIAELAADPGTDAVLPVDSEGHRQPLCGAYRTAALHSAAAVLGQPAGHSVRALVAPLRVVEFLPPGSDVRTADADTPEQLAALRAAARASGILAADDSEQEEVMQEWVDTLKKALGIEADVDIDVVLDIAKDAAHGVQRPAAPLSTYLVGYAVARGADPAEAAAVVARLAAGWSERA